MKQLNAVFLFMSISRTRFKQQLVTEFIAPKNKRSRKVIILCHGMPSVPKKNKVMKFFAEKGYWVFFPHYRGTWESDGQFLKKSPHLDIIDVLDGLPKGFEDFWTEKNYQLKPTKVVLLGSSFGGTAVLLASQDKRVDQVIALAPVCDWQEDSKVEPLDWLGDFVKKAFGNAYRFTMKDWKKLQSGNFFNPIKEAKNIDGKKILIIHGKEDPLASYKASKEFAMKTGATLKTILTDEHFSTSKVIDPTFFRKIKSFLV